MKECCVTNGDNFLKGWNLSFEVYEDRVDSKNIEVTGLNFSVSNNVPVQNEFLGTRHTTVKHNSHLCH